jgi:acetate kinase
MRAINGGPFMSQAAASPVVLTVNGGSSSIKFGAYEPGEPPRRVFGGQVERIGQPDATLSAKGGGADVDKQPIAGGDHGEAVGALIGWLRGRIGDRRVAAIGHRVVHGGLGIHDHAVVTPALLDQLRAATPLDPAHLPREIGLIESFAKAFGGVPQVACFDTVFFRDLPAVARTLPIPKRYTDAGVRRFGFHGISYGYLMGQLRRLDPEAADGRVILAHLGSGASMAAVAGGQAIDTTMSFTPTAGLVMGTRCGDLDPGFVSYLLRTEHPSADRLDELLNKRSGMLGVSGTSGDLRDLMARRATDADAALAIGMFCTSAKRWVGALAAEMGGVDTIVFAGGIGEHAAEARAEICEGLGFLGVEVDPAANAKAAGVISRGRAAVRVITTDEEVMIATITAGLTRVGMG